MALSIRIMLTFELSAKVLILELQTFSQKPDGQLNYGLYASFFG